MYRDISSDILEISRMVNTTPVASLVQSIMEKISTDEKGKVTSIALDKGCPSAAREKIDVASQAAQMNEKMLKAKQEALKSAIEKANKDGDTEVAKALQGKMDKVVEARRTNSENIDRLESVASDYALKYKPKDDLGDQRAHALFLQKQREKLEQRMKREEDAGFPSGDAVEKIKRRLERVTTAQTESDKWFETNDPNWSKVSKAVGGDEKTVAANEKEKLSATMKGSAEEKPQAQQAEPKAAEAEKAPKEAEWFRVAKEARPGGTWQTAKGKFGAKSSSGEVGNGRKGVRYFTDKAAAQQFAAGESQASAEEKPQARPRSKPQVANTETPKKTKAAAAIVGSPSGKKKTAKKPVKKTKTKTRKESLAHEMLDNYLAEATYKRSGLGRWFEDESATSEPGWDRYNTKGERIGKCGDAEEGEAYAACLSKQKADKLGKEGISSFVRRKRAAQKKAGMAKKGTGEAGGGEEPVRVSTGIDKVDEDWSQEYKDSIDCNNPKGFSQKAHCQGKEKKMNEAPELDAYIDPPVSKKEKFNKQYRDKKKKIYHPDDEKFIGHKNLGEIYPGYELHRYTIRVTRGYSPHHNHRFSIVHKSSGDVVGEIDAGGGKIDRNTGEYRKGTDKGLKIDWVHVQPEYSSKKIGTSLAVAAYKHLHKLGYSIKSDRRQSFGGAHLWDTLRKDPEVKRYVKFHDERDNRAIPADKLPYGGIWQEDPSAQETTLVLHKKKVNEGKEISIDELKDAIQELIALIKKHEKFAYEAKKAGNMAEYKKHRGHIAEFSADIKTIQDMINRAMRNRAMPITEEEEGEGKPLNKPFRTPGEKKKFAVYVKNDSGNIVKVRFGDPNMEIKRDDPDRLKAFRSRHSCDDNPGPKWKARYWSCQMWRSDKGVSDIIAEAEKNEPTNPELWEKIQDLVAGRIGSIEHDGKKIEGPNGGKGFDVHPSAYSNAWASKLYGQLGGNWRAVKKESHTSSMKDTVKTIVENTLRKKS